MSQLEEAEIKREHLCRSIACPTCGARPLRRCRYEHFGPKGNRLPFRTSHVHRYLAAVAAGLVPPVVGLGL